MAAGQGQVAANGRATRTRLKTYRHAISHMHVPSSRPLADAARNSVLATWTMDCSASIVLACYAVLFLGLGYAHGRLKYGCPPLRFCALAVTGTHSVPVAERSHSPSLGSPGLLLLWYDISSWRQRHLHTWSKFDPQS